VDIEKGALERFFLDLDRIMVNGENTYANSLENFFERLGFRFRIFDEIKKQADIYLSSDFNVFNFIRPDENRLSDMIEEILSPEGSHGQAETFLNEFLNLLRNKGLALDLTGKVSISREYPTENVRRIDILLKFEDGTIIGIENKPQAKEQIRQVGDYVAYLETISPDKFVFVFIHGYGKEPISIEADKLEDLKNRNRFFNLSYVPDFRDWLNSCYGKCKSEKFRFFLMDFINYVQKEFVEVMRNE